MGQGGGTDLLYVLKYINNIGLLVSSACTNPQERNLDAAFIQTTERKKLSWYERLGGDKVIKCLRTYPLLATMYSHISLKCCQQVMYADPTMEDIADFAVPLDKRHFHTVLLVGSFKLRMDNSERVFVIAQNSHGTDLGFKGYVVIPFDIPDLFFEFWLPMLRPEMDGYVDHNRLRRIAGSKRKVP